MRHLVGSKGLNRKMIWKPKRHKYLKYNSRFYDMKKFIKTLFQEWRDIESMNTDNMHIRDEIEVMRAKYAALKKFAQDKKIIIPLELESI